MTTTYRKRSKVDSFHPTKKLKPNLTQLKTKKNGSTISSISNHRAKSYSSRNVGIKTNKNDTTTTINSDNEEDEENEDVFSVDEENESDSSLSTTNTLTSSSLSLKKSKNTAFQDEEITSDSSIDEEESEIEEIKNQKLNNKHLSHYRSGKNEFLNNKNEEEINEEEEEKDRELADEKRVRLAKAYLEELKLKSEQRKKEDGFDAAELDREIIAKRLKEDKLQTKGILFRPIAKFYTPSNSFIEKLTLQKFPKSHPLSLTCVCVSSTHGWAYTGSKDGSITQWTIDPPQKRRFIPGLSKKKHSLKTSKGHFATITSLVMYQSLYLISSSEDHLIHVWDLTTLTHVHTFQGHRGKVTGLALNPHEPVLYSCSEDKTVKLWDLLDFSYIETLFGHQEPITHISSFNKETCLTSGGREATLRYWKITDQSQLIFRSSQLGSLDVVIALDTYWLLAGNDQGGLALWHRSKKKPMHTIPQAHDQWITCLSVIPCTDFVLSGSLDGSLKLWKILTSQAVKQSTLSSSSSSSSSSLSAPVKEEHKEDQENEEDEEEEEEEENERTLNETMKLHPGYGRLHCIGSLKVPGCINDICIVPPSIYPPIPKGSSMTKNNDSNSNSTHAATDIHVYLAIGQEHKLGRWWQFKQVKNRLYKLILPVSKPSSSSSSS